MIAELDRKIDDIRLNNSLKDILAFLADTKNFSSHCTRILLFTLEQIVSQGDKIRFRDHRIKKIYLEYGKLVWVYNLRLMVKESMIESD